MNIYENLEKKLDSLLINPSNSQLYNEIGVLLYEISDFDKSQMYLEKAYHLCPKDKDVLYNYGLLLYHKLKLKEAKSIFKKYIKVEPNDIDVLEKMVDVYYRLDDYKMASKMLNCINECRGGEI